MQKVILLIRVSTSYQSYDAQSTELIEYVKRDGYSDEDMVIIKDKESATKLPDEERQGLTKMYEAINDVNNAIEAVYCWELSRLSRKPESLYKVRNELLSKRIDLRTKQENFKLLNSNKELDRNSNTMLGFYISMCENEILQKVERTKRIKIKKALEGKYTGGLYKYGYCIDPETKEYRVNNKESEIIKMVYDLYETGKYGLNTLYKEMINRGYKINIHQINRILTSPEYKGGIRAEYVQKQKRRKQKEDRIIHHYDRYYPHIIDSKQYDKCREIAKQNNTNIDKSKNIYYAHKLIKCSSCGAYLVASKHTVQYQCPKKYSPLTKIECNANDRINVNAIDSLLWFLTKKKEALFILNQSKKQIKEYQNKIKEYQLKLDATNDTYNIIREEKRNQLRKQIPVEAMDEIQLNVIVEKAIINDKRDIEENIAIWENEIKRLNKLIIDLENHNETYTDIISKKLKVASKINHLIKELDKIIDDKTRYDLVHKQIKEVIISNKKKNFTKQIDIYFYDYDKETYYYDYRESKENKRLYYLSTINLELQKQVIPQKPIHSNPILNKISEITDISKKELRLMLENDKILNPVLISEFDIEQKYFLPFEVEKRYLRKDEKKDL